MEMMPLSPDLADFLQILNQRKVGYMVVGGRARSPHGWSRLTKNLDTRVDLDPENAIRVQEAVTRSGVPGDLRPDLFTEDAKNVFFLGRPPFRIDLISAVDNVKFDDWFARSVEVERCGVRGKMVGLEDFRVNKPGSGPSRDIADFDQLEGGFPN